VLKRLLQLIFILILLNAKAQNFDSLLLAVKLLPHDTDRINVFYSEGFNKRASNPQFSFQCARQAEQIAQKVSLPFYIAKASNLLGVLFYRKSDLATALSYHKKALGLRTIINDKRGIAISNINLGNIYTDLNKTDLAQLAYQESLRHFNEIGDSKQCGNCLLNLGVLYMGVQKNELAKNYFLSAIQNAQQRNDYEMEATSLNNLAVININKGAYEEAIGNCMNSIKLKDMMENEVEKADSYLNLAIAYYKLNEKKFFQYFLDRADSLIDQFDYSAARLHSLKLKTDCYKEAKNYELAFHSITNYMLLNDSLRKVNENLTLANNFLEIVQKSGGKEKEGFQFPFIYLNILLLTLVLIAAGIFYFKR
jgi:tetratricopeptide (TPR) repeat protein